MVAGYLLMAVMAGARDSPITTPLPAGARPPAWSARVATMLGFRHLGRPGIIAVALFVAAGLVLSFVVLLVEASLNRVRLSTVLAAVGISLVVATAAPILLSRDVFSYAAYGRILALDHHNPYVSVPASFPHDPFVAVMSRQWLHVRSPYGPLFTLSSAAIVRAWTASPGAVIVADKILAGAGIAVATVCAAAAAVRVRPERAALAAAVVGLNPVIVIHTVGGGHADALLAAALAAAFALAVSVPAGGINDRGHEAWKLRGAGATVLLALATMIKLVAAPALALWLWWLIKTTPRRGRVAAASIHIALVVALTAASYGPILRGRAAFGTVWKQAGVEGWASPAHLVARGAQAFFAALAGPAAGNAAGASVLAAFLAVYGVLLWRLGSRATATTSPADEWGSALLLLALFSPFLLPWYAAWFVPFLALMQDEALMWIGVAICGLLALTLIPADPPQGLTTPGVMAGVHYVVAPLMLGLLAAAVVRVLRRPSA